MEVIHELYTEWYVILKTPLRFSFAENFYLLTKESNENFLWGDFFVCNLFYRNKCVIVKFILLRSIKIKYNFDKTKSHI